MRSTFSAVSKLLDLLLWLLIAALALAVVSYAAFCAAHIVVLLRYPFPLDYGEGPLLAQVQALANGAPLWQLYADPARPPYLVVNYPPVYPLLAAALSYPLGSALLAGRVVSLLATLATLLALAVLLIHSLPQDPERRRSRLIVHRSSFFVLALLTVPVVREWAALMRVDMLALALGLCGLALMALATKPYITAETQRARNSLTFAALRLCARSCLLVAPGLLFALALYTKPSMLAAPFAGALWLLLGRWRHLPLAARLLVALAWALLAALPLVILQWASGGWFWLHVVWANANRWDAALARQIWADQLRLRWPLFAAGAIGAIVCVIRDWYKQRDVASQASSFIVPLAYAAGALVTAMGVGKVGAYANYFLELYVALVWLAGAALGPEHRPARDAARVAQRAEQLETRNSSWPSSLFAFRSSLFALLCLTLLFASTLRYSPVWSTNQLKLAGLLEPNPPRLAWGRYGLWGEAAREAQVLAAMGRAQALIAREVRDQGGPVFTDMPGFAANAGALAPLQVFEHRQLMDTGRWDQRALLVELANGTLPLAVLDYLGNWITPEMIAIFTHRYGQDGSLGPFDIYRPINPGARRPVSLSFAGLRLAAYRLVPPNAPARTFAPGALLVPTVEWQRVADRVTDEALDVVFVLKDSAGNVAVESVAPLLYGALPPNDWPTNTLVQHMQPFALPEDLPSERYTLLVTLRASGADLAPLWPLAQLAVAADGGQRFESG
ncbi:MAG: DUF2029 domain-containing protein, partial [Chloroflexales bacterium]|nr:DUF2029 domain-containing protein [Chloroflexales bacterium]